MRCVIANLELSRLIAFSELSVVPTFEASNLGLKQPKRRWRADITQATVNCDLTDALAAAPYHGITTYRYIELLYMNVTDAATFEVWLGPTLDSVQDTGTASWYSTALTCWRSDDSNRNRFPRKHNWIDLGAQVSYPFCRVKINDPFNTSGFVEMGNLIFHPGYEPERGIQAWPKIMPREELRQSVSAGGSRHRQERPKERVGEVVFQASGPNALSEVLKWTAFQHTVGISKPVCLIIDADIGLVVGAGGQNCMDYIVYGLVEELQSIPLAGNYDSYTWSLKVGELL